MAKKGIAWTPTITAYTYLYEQTKQMIEAGVDMDNPIAARAVHDQAFFKPAFEAYRDNFKKHHIAACQHRNPCVLMRDLTRSSTEPF